MTIKDIFSLDIRSITIFRVSISLIVIIDTFNRFSILDAFYTDDGILPRELIQLGELEHVYHFQILFLSGQEWFTYLLFSILIFFSILLLVGYRTNLSAFFVWLLFCSIIVRDGYTDNSGDTLLILLLFWSMFLPLGRMLSIDSLINNVSTPNKNVFSAASVAMYLQFAAVYITTGLHKAEYMNWLNGSHLYYTFSRLEFVDPTVFWIYSNYGFLEFLTYASLIIELFGPLLFFIPFYFFAFRMAGILLLMGLQISIIQFMDVGVFSYVSIAGILIFLPTQFWKLKVVRDLFEIVGSRLRKLTNGVLKNVYTPQRNKKNTSLYSGSKIEGFKNFGLSILILYLCVWNFDNVSNLFDLPGEAKKAGYFLKLDQSWRMFSSPIYTSEYYTVEAIFDDGHKENLLRPLQKYYRTPNGSQHVLFKYNRWRKFFVNEIKFGSRVQMFSERIVDYFISQNLEVNERRRLSEVNLVEYQRTTGEKYNHSDFERKVIFSKDYQ